MPFWTRHHYQRATPVGEPGVLQDFPRSYVLQLPLQDFVTPAIPVPSPVYPLPVAALVEHPPIVQAPFTDKNLVDWLNGYFSTMRQRAAEQGVWI
jgi:hypothetical protein